MAALRLQQSVGWGSARLFALLALACCSSICSTHGVAAQGIPIQVHEVALLAASAGGEPDQQLDVRRVDYNDRQASNNTIDYCGNAFCGPCAMLPDDPCKVADGYGADTSLCMLPDMVGGTVPLSALCGVGASAQLPPPDSLSSNPAGQVYVFRNTSGVLFVSVSLTCNWLMVADASSQQGMSGSVSYSLRSLDFTQDFSVPLPSSKQRYSCFTAAVPLTGLSSVCQNLDASVQVSFYVQRFGAISPTTCSELSAPTLVQVTVDLSKQEQAGGSSGLLGAQVGASDSAYGGATPTSDAILQPSDPPPAVLAMLQLQLDLSGPAAMAWMDNLTSSGPSCDVNVLGHDVGALVVLPDAFAPAVPSGGGPGQAACVDGSVAAMAQVVATMGDALKQSGGAVRSWKCLAVQAAQVNLPAPKLPWCIAGNQSASGASLLALALRLPPGTTTASTLRLIARSIPSAGCMSSESQLDVCTDVQARVLGGIPTVTAYSSVSVTEPNLRAAALQIAPLLLPPQGAPVAISMLPYSASSFAVLTAAGRTELWLNPSSGTSGSDPRPCVGCPVCNSSSSSSVPSWVLYALAACCGALLLIVAVMAGLMVAMSRRHRQLLRSGDADAGPGKTPATATAVPPAVMGAQRGYPHRSLRGGGGGGGGGRFSLGKKRTVPEVLAWNHNSLYDLEENPTWRSLSRVSVASATRAGQGQEQRQRAASAGGGAVAGGWQPGAGVPVPYAEEEDVGSEVQVASVSLDAVVTQLSSSGDAGSSGSSSGFGSSSGSAVAGQALAMTMSFPPGLSGLPPMQSPQASQPAAALSSVATPALEQALGLPAPFPSLPPLAHPSQRPDNGLMVNAEGEAVAAATVAGAAFSLGHFMHKVQDQEEGSFVHGQSEAPLARQASALSSSGLADVAQPASQPDIVVISAGSQPQC